MPKGLAVAQACSQGITANLCGGLGTACNTSVAEHLHVRCPALISLALRKGNETESDSAAAGAAVTPTAFGHASQHRGAAVSFRVVCSLMEAASTYYTPHHDTDPEVAVLKGCS